MEIMQAKCNMEVSLHIGSKYLGDAVVTGVKRGPGPAGSITRDLKSQKNSAINT